MEVAGATQIGMNDDSLVGSGLACRLAGKKGRDGFVGERSDGKGPCGYGLRTLAIDVLEQAQDAQAGWLPLQDRLAKLSTNSSHRVVPSTHIALVTDQTAAQTSIQAIRDVVRAVRCNATVANTL